MANSEANHDPEAVIRLIRWLGSDDDIALYRDNGAEICPDSGKQNADLAMRITQISDCVIVSAEVSPAGMINIVNFCRKTAERLLLREGVLCQGYLTRGKIVHDGTMVFGSGYQAAVAGEKAAAAIELPGEVLGTPFIEIDPVVVAYHESSGDKCTREMFSRMTISADDSVLISPYGIFDRFANWALDPSKSRDQVRNELRSARQIIDKVSSKLAASRPRGQRAQAKLDVSFRELSKARDRLVEAEGKYAVTFGSVM